MRRVFSIVIILLFVLPAAALGKYLAEAWNVPRLAVVAVLVLVAYALSQSLEDRIHAKLFPKEPFQAGEDPSPAAPQDESERE